MLRLRSAALTDIGKLRRRNEDRFLCDDSLHLYGVADGIGGLPGGAEAAQITVDTLRDRLRDAEAPTLSAALQAANAAVLGRAAIVSPHVGMGSTLTAGLFREATLTLAHVGDSRAYRWRAGQLTTLTRDHSVENEAHARGETESLRWMTESNRHALTRCIGQPPPLVVDETHHELQPGDRYLFATDGVSRVLGDGALAADLAGPGEPRDVLQRLIELVLRRGAPDNATAVLVFVDEL